MIRSTGTLAGRQPLRVGIAGLGRSGWNIHAKTIGGMPDAFTVHAVADPSTARRREAERDLDAVAYADFEGLIRDPLVDVVVVASPNRMHANQACDAMLAGKHVVCEKPMALCVRDADRMIDVSEQTGRLLAPFQNRRYEPHFLKVKEVIDSGVLGRIIQVRIEWSFFTRRWDWQTLKDLGGGSLNNHCAHLLDHAMQLFGTGEPKVFADLKRSLTLGDADDHAKIILYGDDAPTIDIETSSACAYPEDRWHVIGTSGGLRGSLEHLEWKWVDWSVMPDRDVDARPAYGRLYQREDYDWNVATWDAPPNGPTPPESFYRDLQRALCSTSPMPITPQSVRRQIAVLEACHELSQV